MSRVVARQDASRRLQYGLWAAAGLGIAFMALGAVLHWGSFLHSYLFAWVFIWGLSSGALGMLLIHGMTGGGWGLALQRPLQAAADLLPLLGLLLLPVLFGLGHVYDWLGSGHESEVLEKKAWYLNATFFYVRAAGYFLLWTLLAWAVGHGLRRRARGDAGAEVFLYRVGAGGLILHVLLVTFAGVDWIMSLQARFYSTIFGMMIIAGQFLCALAAAAIATVLREGHPALAPYVDKDRRRDIGNLMLAALVMWAYLVFMQYLIVWNGNLPKEIVWYLPRMQTSWFWLGVAFLVVAFIVPLFGLFLRSLKQSRSGLAAIAGTVLLGQVFYGFWLVAPAFRQGGFAVMWTDIAALVGLIGLWGAAFLWRLLTLPAAPAAAEHEARMEVKQHA